MPLPEILPDIGVNSAQVLKYYDIEYQSDRIPQLPPGSQPKGRTQHVYMWGLRTGKIPGDATAISLLCMSLLEKGCTPNTNEFLRGIPEFGLLSRRPRAIYHQRYISQGLLCNTIGAKKHLDRPPSICEQYSEQGYPPEVLRRLIKGLRYSLIVAALDMPTIRNLLLDATRSFVNDTNSLPISQRFEISEPSDDPHEWYQNLRLLGGKAIGAFLPYELESFKELLDIYDDRPLPITLLTLNHYLNSRTESLSGDNGFINRQSDLVLPIDARVLSTYLHVLTADLPNDIFMSTLEEPL